MGSVILKVLLCFVIPLLMLMGLLEKRSRQIILFLIIGCAMCFAASSVNSYCYTRFGMSYFYLTTTFAPICEETLKFIPILLFGALASKDKNRLLPPAFAVGIGFAVIENSYMLVQNTDGATVAWLILRGIGTGLMHGMTTVFMGYGISIAATDKRITAVGTVTALFLAIMYHGAYNCLIQTGITEYFGILLPGITYGAILLIYYKDKIVKFLTEKQEDSHE